MPQCSVHSCSLSLAYVTFLKIDWRNSNAQTSEVFRYLHFNLKVIFSWPLRSSNYVKSSPNTLYCRYTKWQFLDQHDNHICWDSSMPTTSINSILDSLVKNNSLIHQITIHNFNFTISQFTIHKFTKFHGFFSMKIRGLWWTRMNGTQLIWWLLGWKCLCFYICNTVSTLFFFSTSVSFCMFHCSS